MNVALELSKDEYGRSSLCATLHFEVPVKILTYAWMEREIWWTKSSMWSTNYNWNAQYHHLRDGTRQVIVTCASILQNCVIPAGFDPDASSLAEVEMLKPSVLYQKGEHGLGLVVVPEGAATSMRNGIWRLKQTHMNPSLQPLSQALMFTRAGHAFTNDALFLPLGR